MNVQITMFDVREKALPCLCFVQPVLVPSVWVARVNTWAKGCEGELLCSLFTALTAPSSVSDTVMFNDILYQYLRMYKRRSCTNVPA
jgi:hypothetical protein